MNRDMSGSVRGLIDEMLSGSVAGNIKVETSGGSTVTITPTLESGTKIADFQIDDTSGVLYAPTPEPPIEYTAGDNIQISEENVISATDTTYTAGNNITIENGVISASGESSINYSTTEQVVGTWVDGKPLYQKTFSGSYQLSNSWTNTGEVIQNGIIVKSEAVVYESDGNSLQVLGNITTNGEIYLYSLRPSTTYVVNYFTLWYTKSTDSIQD